LIDQRPDDGAKPDRRNRARRYEEEIASTLCLHSGLRCVRFHDGLILSAGSHPEFNGEKRQDYPPLRQSSAVSTVTSLRRRRRSHDGAKATGLHDAEPSSRLHG